jgi:hypothetical protein
MQFSSFLCYSSFLGTDILHSTLFSNIICVPPLEWKTVFRIKTKQQVKLFCILYVICQNR